MIVKNIIGTSDNNCGCASWLDHWKTYTKQTSLPNYCTHDTCTEKPVVGAHVIKVGSEDKDWYIVPLCKKHNKEAGEFELFSGTKLAKASVSKTCG